MFAPFRTSNVQEDLERKIIIFSYGGYVLAVPTFGVAALTILAGLFFWGRGDRLPITKAHIKYHFYTAMIFIFATVFCVLNIFVYAYFFGNNPLPYEGYIIGIPIGLAFLWIFFRLFRAMYFAIKWASPL